MFTICNIMQFLWLILTCMSRDVAVLITSLHNTKMQFKVDSLSILCFVSPVPDHLPTALPKQKCIRAEYSVCVFSKRSDGKTFTTMKMKMTMKRHKRLYSLIVLLKTT